MQRRIIIGLCVYMVITVLGGLWYSLTHKRERMPYPITRVNGENGAQGTADSAEKDLVSILASVWGRSSAPPGDLSPSQEGGADAEVSPGPETGPQPTPKLPAGGTESTVAGVSGADQTPEPSAAQTSDSASTLVSEEQLKSLERRVSISDRVAALNIIRKRLSVSEVRQMALMSSNGITAAEKRAIVEILNSKLPPDELSKVKDLFLKYAD